MRKESLVLASKRLLIATAVNSLCEGRDLDDVPIEEICRAADISRSGFYRTFGSKYDIATWCQTFPLTEGIGKMGHTHTCHEGLNFSFEGLSLFKTLISASKGSPEMSVCDDESRQLVADMLKDTLQRHHRVDVDDILSFQVDWVVAAGMVMAQDWMAGKLDKTPSEMADLIEESYPPRLRNLLNHPVERNGSRAFDMGTMISIALKGSRDSGLS